MSTSHTQPPTKLDLTSPNLPNFSASSARGGDQPPSPQLEKSAARAMSSTDSWTPTLGERKQSYAKEDHKHALQMSGIQEAATTAGGGAGGAGGAGGKGGFSESQ